MKYVKKTDKEIIKNWKYSSIRWQLLFFKRQIEKHRGIVFEIWINTEDEVQEKNADMLIKIMKESDPDKISRIWAHTCTTVQQDKIIEVMKIFPDKVEDIWEKTEDEVQDKYFPKVIKLFPEKINIIWRCTKDKIQEKSVLNVIKLFPEEIDKIWKNTKEKIQEEIIIELIENNPKYIGRICRNTSKNVQEKKVFSLMEKFPNSIGVIWRNIDEKVQDKLIYRAINTDNPIRINRLIWINTNMKIQEEHENLCKLALNGTEEDKDVLKYTSMKVIQHVLKENDYRIGERWGYLNEEKQQELLVPVINDNPDKKYEIWINTHESVQEKNNDVFLQIINGNTDKKHDIWAKTCRKIQEKNAEVFSQLMSENLRKTLFIWSNTCEKIQEDKIDDFVTKIKESENSDTKKLEDLNILWINISESVQQKKSNVIIEIASLHSGKPIKSAWEKTCAKVQEERIMEVLEKQTEVDAIRVCFYFYME